MGFYFTADVGWLNYFWRKLAQRTGHAFLLGYTFMLFWYLASSLGWLIVPDPLLLWYLILYELSLLYIISLIYDVVSNRWGRTNRIIAQIAGRIYEAFRPYLLQEIARFWGRWHRRLPENLQRRIGRLGNNVGWGHAFDRRIRRGYIVLFPVFVVSFFIVRQIRVSQGEPSDYASVEALIGLLVALAITIRLVVLASREGELFRTN